MESVEGWNGNSPVFKLLLDEIKPKVIIEVGSWKGQSTINMLRNSEASIYCVDTWLGALEFHTHPTPERDLKNSTGYPQMFYDFKKNIFDAGFEERVAPVALPSNLAAKLFKFKDVKVDMIYIDASHEYEDVLSDCESYWQLLNEGGILFGDDYGNVDFKGVKKAVDEFAVSKKLEIYKGWFWIIRK